MTRKPHRLLALIGFIVTAYTGVLTEPLVGEWIIFSCELPLGSLDVYKVRPDGTELTQIHSSDNNPYGYAGVSISADGTELIYIDNRELTFISLKIGHKRRLFSSIGGGSDFEFVYSQESNQFVVYTMKGLAEDGSGPLFLFQDIKNARLIRTISHYDSPLAISSLTRTKLVGQTLNFVFVIDIESNRVQQLAIEPREYNGISVGWVGMSPDEQYMLFEIQQPQELYEAAEPRVLEPASDFSPTFRYDLYRQVMSTGKVESIAQGIQPHVVSSPDGDRLAFVQYKDSAKTYELIIAQSDGSDHSIVLSHPCMRHLETWSST